MDRGEGRDVGRGGEGSGERRVGEGKGGEGREDLGDSLVLGSRVT